MSEKAEFRLDVGVTRGEDGTFTLVYRAATCLYGENITPNIDSIASGPVPHQVNEIIKNIVAFARRGSIPVKFSFAVAYVRLGDDLFTAYDTCRHSANADGLSQVVFPPTYLCEKLDPSTSPRKGAASLASQNDSSHSAEDQQSNNADTVSQDIPTTGILQGLNALFGTNGSGARFSWYKDAAVLAQDVLIRGFSMKDGEDVIDHIDFTQHMTVKRFPLGEFFRCLPLPGFGDAYGGHANELFPEQVFCVAGLVNPTKWELNRIARENLVRLGKAFESDESLVRLHGPTGKSAFAHALHRGFLRTGDFVQIDVLRYPEWESLEALLFGHLEARGLPGSLVSRARRGTIFIDNTDWLDAITRNRLLAAIEARWHLLRRGGDHRLVEFPDTNWILGHSTRASDGGDDRNHAAVSFESFLANPLEALPEGNGSQPLAESETAARSYLHALLYYGAYRKRFVANRDTALPTNPYLEPSKWQFQSPSEEPVIRGYAEARAYAELNWRTLTAEASTPPPQH